MKKQRLLAIIIEQGKTQKEIAEKMGICRKTFYEKMRKGTFGLNEVQSLMEILNISTETAADIFLSE